MPTNAKVTVYSLDNALRRTTIIYSGFTSADGLLSFDMDMAGPIEVTLTGGTYQDPFTGKTVELADKEISTILLDGWTAGFSLSITPLTNAMTVLARALTRKGFTINNAVKTAIKRIADCFGLHNIDFTQIIPADLTDPDQVSLAQTPQTLYGAIISALSVLAYENNLSPIYIYELAEIVALDLTDGIVDNSNSGSRVGANLLIRPTTIIHTLERKSDTFLASAMNLSGLLPSDVFLRVCSTDVVVKNVTFSLSPDATTIEEGKAIELTVTLSQAQTEDIAIRYTTVGTSAKANRFDFVGYTFPFGAVLFPAGTTVRTFPIFTEADVCIGFDDPVDLFSTTISLIFGNATAGANTEHTLSLEEFKGGC